MKKKPALKFTPPAAASGADAFVRRGRAGAGGEKALRQQTVYLTPDLKRWLHHYSVDRGSSVSQVVEMALEMLRTGGST